MIVNTIVLHHSASSKNTTIEQINAWHKARGFALSSLNYYIGYHYVILGNGTVIQTRRDNEMGAHTIPNDGKLGICLTGNFMIEEPSDAQMSSLIPLVNKLKLLYGIKNVKAHREFSRTECCGDNLFKYVLKERISWLQQLLDILLNYKGKNGLY